jgi:HIRAN domain-containing protein
MGILKRLLGQTSPHVGSGRTEATLYSGNDRLEVKGESFYQENLRRVVAELGRDLPALLVPEPDNEYDRNAVSVWAGGLKVGHLSREDAAVYQPAIARLIQQEGKPLAMKSRIFGGEKDKPSLGIWLLHDREDFGLTSVRGRQAPRTGGPDLLTGASTGGQRWMDRLPNDRLAAIKALRGYLDREKDPIQRHFMFNTVEDHLYACRDIFASALTEFDEACDRHHLEMTSIRPALILEFGGVPTVPMYRQMAIRKEKAQAYADGLAWAERGLTIYGHECIREDAVDDLQKRVVRLKAKVDRG